MAATATAPGEKNGERVPTCSEDAQQRQPGDDCVYRHTARTIPMAEVSPIREYSRFGIVRAIIFVECVDSRSNPWNANRLEEVSLRPGNQSRTEKRLVVVLML
jgi:hypothetical protein